MTRDRWIRRGATGALLLGGAWAALQRPGWQRLDVALGDALRRASSPTLDRVVPLTTDLGSLYAVAGTAAVLAATRRRRLAGDVLLLGVVAWNAGQASKTQVRRARPYDAEGTRRLIRRPTGTSFPSGHATQAAAVFSFLATAMPNPLARATSHATWAYVALSRIYCGVHYPTDVVGGAGLGLILGAIWRGPVAGAARLAGVAALRGVRKPLSPVRRFARGAARGGGGR